MVNWFEETGGKTNSVPSGYQVLLCAGLCSLLLNEETVHSWAYFWHHCTSELMGTVQGCYQFKEAPRTGWCLLLGLLVSRHQGLWIRLSRSCGCPSEQARGRAPTPPPSRSWECDLAAAAMSPLAAGTSGRQNDRCWAALVDVNLQMNF